MKKSCLAILLGASLQAYAGPEEVQGQPFVTVGGDNACQYSDIQSAIDGGLSNTIRIASNKSYFESLFIQNGTKTLVGGYADCAMANINITDLSQAIVTSNGAQAALRLEAVIAQDVDFTVRNLMLANGGAGVSVSAQHSGHIDVLLDNVRLINNDNTGLYVGNFNEGTALVQVRDSLIDFNQESGMQCLGDGLKIRVGGDTVIADNDGNTGGGIRAADGCEVDVFSPTVIRDNAAVSSGGGIYAINTTVSVQSLSESCDNGVCFGEPDQTVTISGNQAFSGGGVYASLPGTTVGIYNALIEDNEASQGGGLYAADGAVIQAVGYQSPGNPCWSPGACLQMHGNQAEGGGALRLNGASEMILVAAKLTDHSAHNGMVAYLSGDAVLTIKDAVLADNGEAGNGTYADNSLLYQANAGDLNATTLTLDGVTIADNKLTNAVVYNANGGQADVYGSLIFDDQDVYFASGNNAGSHFECVIAHENSSFTAGGTVSVVDRQVQPVFVNPMVGNYHLRVDSPAIDYCYDASGNASSDIDYDTRGVDDPEVSNLHGLYDLGADEYHPANDVIFAHDFDAI
jgi:hypothetical protein